MPRDVSKYHVNGEPVVSVTEALDCAGFVDLTRIPFDVLEEARVRGTAVHTWLELLITQPDSVRGVEPPEVIRGYIVAWENWIRDSAFEVLGAEEAVVDPVYRYGGTYDLDGKVNGRRAIVDYKARYGLTAEVGPQTAGYLGAYRAAHDIDPAQPFERYALLLRPTGRYTFEPQNKRQDLAAFRHAVGVANWQIANGVTSIAKIRKGNT